MNDNKVLDKKIKDLNIEDITVARETIAKDLTYEECLRLSKKTLLLILGLRNIKQAYRLKLDEYCADKVITKKALACLIAEYK